MRRLPRTNSATGTSVNSAPLRRTERPVPKNRFFTSCCVMVTHDESLLYVITVSDGAMSVSVNQQPAAWLLLVFTLPTAKASERVGVWRKLQRYGAVALPASGYVLPNNSMNQERFEWLATSIRSSKGQAAVAHVSSFDELRNEQIEHMFNEARTREYQILEKELKKLAKPSNRGKLEPGVVRLKRGLQQIVEVTFFGSPIGARIEEAVQQLESVAGNEKAREGKSPKL